LGRLKMPRRNLQPVRLQLFKEGWAYAGCSEGTMDAMFIGMLLNEPIDFLHLYNLSLHASNFADARYAAFPIRKPLKLDNDPYCRGNCTSDAAGAHWNSGHSDHLFKSFHSIAR